MIRYSKNLKKAKLDNVHIPQSMIDEASDYSVGINVAELMPAIVRNSMPIAQQQILEPLLDAIQQQFLAFRQVILQDNAAFRQVILQDNAAFRQEIHQDIAAFRQEIHQDIAGFRQEIHQDIAGFRQEIRQELETIRQDLGIIRTLAARSYNFSCKVDGILALLPNVNNQLPVNFPQNIIELANIPRRRCDDILTFYQLDVNGTIGEKRLRIQRHIGVYL